MYWTEWVELQERLQQRFLAHGVEALHHVAFHDLFDQVGRKSVGAAFEEVEFADEVLGQVPPRPAFSSSLEIEVFRPFSYSLITRCVS